MIVPELVAQWRTGPVGAIVAVEIWGRQVLRDGLLRIVADDLDLDIDAGSVTAGGTDAVFVLWRDKARAAFGCSWLDYQAAIVKRRLALRWGVV